MSDIIHLLPDSVANQIAAGEVVQRPASIVKEMVENSIDAGASNIQVIITDGGKTCVQIIDNGSGMSETDARMSFERHATSKISSAADLFTLSTMGFRGEALASIAAVAEVDLKTRRKDDELGTHLRIAGSRVVQQEPTACPVGSNFEVRNLFYNVPARRKFLKSTQTELSNIVNDFERMVLVYPHINFTLISNGAEVYKLERTSLRQRIVDVFGKKINADLLPIESETSLVQLSGFVANPTSSKKKGTHQFFFVNGRYMRHPYFHSAVMHAYENLIPQGDHISYFIYMSVDPAKIDVNVHPTKTEIKFEGEQAIWQVLSATVKETLGKYSNIPSIDFDTVDRPYIPVVGTTTGQISTPSSAMPSYNPFDDTHNYHRTPTEWEELYKGMEHFRMDVAGGEQRGGTSLVDSSEEYIVDSLIGKGRAGDAVPQLKTIADGQDNEVMDDATQISSLPRFQYKGRFVVTPSAHGLLVVDQHRAHVNILFHQNLERIKNQTHESQRLLFPELVSFTTNEAIAVEQILDQLTYIGFELTNLGGGTYSVEGVPGGIDGLNPSVLLHDLIYAVIETGLTVRQRIDNTIALAMAQSSAIVYGQVLSDDEMAGLLMQLFQLKTPMRTPDGKVVFAIIGHKNIEHLF